MDGDGAYRFAPAPAPAAAQQTTTVTVPPAVAFTVTNVAVPSARVPAGFTVSYVNTSGITGGQRLTISVRTDASHFTPLAGGAGIPADAVSWIVTATERGTGTNGTLTATAFSQVFRASTNSGTGSVTLGWTLAPIAATGLRAGPQTMTIR
jgi:hypothetical protein